VQTFFTADPHFGHARIIELCGRPYVTTKEMNNDLAARWNSVVAEDDTVYVLGDVALGQPVTDSLKHIRRLNGTKYLVAGNHDRAWLGYDKRYTNGNPTGPERLASARALYLESGFDDVINPEPGQALDKTFVLAGEDLPDTEEAQIEFEMSHFPYVGDSHGEDRYVSWRPADRGGWLVHGHVHKQWLQRGRMINVGVDVWAGYPVSLRQIAELIEAGERDLAPLSWQ